MGVKFLAQGNNAMAAAVPAWGQTLNLSVGSQPRYLSATTPPIDVLSTSNVSFKRPKYVLSAPSAYILD
jgi:hypothetical protein